MSTHGMIARETKEGFEGRYHHFDSRPTSLGKALYHLYHGYFQKDLGKMLALLLDEHPAGWSSIVKKDFSLTPGFKNPAVGKLVLNWQETEDGRRPKCYCHGDMKDTSFLLVWGESNLKDLSYAYVFSEENAFLTIYKLSGERNAFLLKIVDLDGEEPIWNEMEIL